MSQEENEIKFVNSYSGATYPIYEYKPVQLSQDGYHKNTYYVRDMIQAPDNFDSNQNYYTVSQEYIALNSNNLNDILNDKIYKRNKTVEGFSLNIIECDNNEIKDTSTYQYYGENIAKTKIYSLVEGVASSNYNNIKSFLYIPKKNTEYILANGEYNSNITYYIKSRYSKVSGTNNFQYVRDKYYYYKPEIDDFILSTDNQATFGRKYFELNEQYNFMQAQELFQVTSEKYKENQYYIKSVDNGYKLATEDFNIETQYYSKTKLNDNYVMKEDTKRLDISLPAVGNAVSDLYDFIYGSPFMLIGYTNKQSNEYEAYTNGLRYRVGSIESLDKTVDESNPKLSSVPTTEKNIPVYKEMDYILIGYIKSNSQQNINLYNGTDKYKYKIGPINNETIYSLTDEQISDNNFIHKHWSVEYTVPVYRSKQLDYRPYSKRDLLNNIDVEPYNNIKVTEPVSVAWALLQMREYVSQFRYLIYEKGLSMNWEADSMGIGYVQNKPRMLWSSRNNDIDNSSNDVSNNVLHSIEYIYKNYKNCYNNNNNQYDNGEAQGVFGIRPEIEIEEDSNT